MWNAAKYGGRKDVEIWYDMMIKWSDTPMENVTTTIDKQEERNKGTKVKQTTE